MSGCGPDGLQLTPQLAALAGTNAAFSQLQWEIAKQDGCQPCASQAFPTWPPRTGSAYTYPMLQSMEEVAGLDTARYGTPYNPTAAEVQGADPAGLACALPTALRRSNVVAPGASAFLPDQPQASAADALLIPDVNLAVEAAEESKPYVDTRRAPDAPHAPVQDADECDLLCGLRSAWHDATHWAAIPGAHAAEKLGAFLSRHARALLVLLLLIAATTAVLTVVL
jgi:hypothetical protein